MISRETAVAETPADARWKFRQGSKTVTVGDRPYEIFDRVLPDPEIAIVEDCMQVYREGGHDGLIGVGGGSAIDIAKSVAAYAGYHGALADLFGVDQVPRKGPPLIAIPTTAGTGSKIS